MRILFCDDDPIILNQLQSFVTEFFKKIGGKQPDFHAYDSGDMLLRSESKADIAFLDVEMPGLSGIHIGSKLKEYNPYIKIFIVTSYPDYLDEAMRFQVFRYLSKPIDKNRLFRNLYTVDGIIQSSDTMEHWRQTMNLPCFYSPHRSYIINMRFVCQIGKDKIFLRYNNQIKEAYLARRKYTHFKDTYLLYLESVT